MIHHVYLDTNIIMALGHGKGDIFSGIENALDGKVEFILLDQVKVELETISKVNKSRDAIAAKLGLSILKTKKVHTEIGAKQDADHSLLEAAVRNKGMVATQDAELKRLLKEKGVPTLSMRKMTFFKSA